MQRIYSGDLKQYLRVVLEVFTFQMSGQKFILIYISSKSDKNITTKVFLKKRFGFNEIYMEKTNFLHTFGA